LGGKADCAYSKGVFRLFGPNSDMGSLRRAEPIATISLAIHWRVTLLLASGARRPGGEGECDDGNS
jgi:hypothetical protein